MKKTHSLSLAAFVAVVASFGAAAAQDNSMEGDNMGNAMQLPQACQTAEAPAMPGMEDMTSAMKNMNETQQAFMRGMMEAHGPMMQGMMAEDPDVAFACGMIPHHQAAISMAEVELQRGDNDQMKQMAQKIIDAQKQEIAELTAWIEQQSQ